MDKMRTGQIYILAYGLVILLGIVIAAFTVLTKNYSLLEKVIFAFIGGVVGGLIMSFSILSGKK